MTSKILSIKPNIDKILLNFIGYPKLKLFSKLSLDWNTAILKHFDTFVFASHRYPSILDSIALSRFHLAFKTLKQVKKKKKLNLKYRKTIILLDDLQTHWLYYITMNPFDQMEILTAPRNKLYLNSHVNNDV